MVNKKDKTTPDVARSLPRGLKKLYYETRAISLRTIIAILIIGGLLLPLVWSLRLAYFEGASARSIVNLYYKEISDAQYPDNSRFTYYDFADLDRIAEALAIVREEYGIYENFEPEELAQRFYVYSYLDSAVRDNVEYSRTQGADFSYVANKYAVVFNQPHDADEPNLLRRIFPRNDSELFLTTLMEVNYRHFVDTLGGVGGFARMTDIGDGSMYDYLELVEVYAGRINTIIDALNGIDDIADGYVSIEHDRTVKDMVGEFKLLRSDLSSIRNFIESSGLTRDLELERNKLNTNLEINTQRYNNSSDIYTINKRAQDAYDHTFTENLIIVAQDNTSDLLYQARPKTAFDSIVLQKQEGMEERAKYRSRIEDLRQRLTLSGASAANREEYERLCRKCEALLETFRTDYDALTDRASAVVAGAYDDANRGFLSYKVEHRSIFDRSFVIKNIFLCGVGVACAFVLCVALNSWGELRKKKKREKILLKMKREEA